jgi:hypothetical protein
MFAGFLPAGAVTRIPSEAEARGDQPASDVASAAYWTRGDLDFRDDAGAIDDDPWQRYGSRMKGRPNATDVETLTLNPNSVGAEYELHSKYLVREMGAGVKALLQHFRRQATVDAAWRLGMPTWLNEGPNSSYRVFLGDLPMDSTLASFKRMWITRSELATAMWNDRRIMDVHVCPQTGRHSHCSSAFVSLTDRKSALQFWNEAETWWVACDPRVGHRKFPFRWLTLRWIMARKVPPGCPAWEDTAWVYDASWRRFDYESWIRDPNRSIDDPDEEADRNED